MVPEIWKAKGRIFLSFSVSFLSFWKIEISKKQKKMPGDIIILHNCPKNYDHMLHCFWDTFHFISFYSSFWAIFCPFTPLKTKQIIKKKHLEISSFYMCTKNYNHVMYSYHSLGVEWGGGVGPSEKLSH